MPMLLFNGMVATLPHVKSGKLRGLAVSSAKRSEHRARSADGQPRRRA